MPTPCSSTLVLGTGQRLFDDGVPNAGFKLEDQKTTSTGVIVATYSTSEGRWASR